MIVPKLPQISEITTLFIDLIFIITSIQTLQAADIDCGQAFECVDQNITASSLSAYGYYSNSGKGSYIRSGDAFFYGTYSGYNAFNISGGSIFCYGSESCVNSSLFSSGFRQNVFCYGLNACSNSVINALGNDVFCYGDNGCSNTFITQVDDVYGYGAYALNNATIQTDNTGASISIFLEGYNAGYNLTVRCLEKDYCLIDCVGNACHSTIFDCKGKANCDIQKMSAYYLDSYTYNMTIETTNISNICNDTKFKVDNEFDNYNSSAINELTNYTNVCCRGAYACSRIDTAISVNNLLCSSGFGCNQIAVDNVFDSIYCTGAGSCSSNTSMSFTANNVYCLGWVSCDSVNVTAKNIYITGTFSGRSMIINGVENMYRFTKDQLNQTITSNGNLNYYSLNDLISGSFVEIICNKNDNCTVKCATTSSCIDTHMVCYGNCMLYCKLKNPQPNYACPNASKMNDGTITYHYISSKTD